jgi:phosphoenolpyruvate-protein kinase (PTS system EI component)
MFVGGGGVMEVGGAMAHEEQTVAREYDISAVVAVARTSRRIVTGRCVVIVASLT